MKRLLTTKDVCEVLGISKATLFNRMKGVYREGGVMKLYKSEIEFPKASRVGGRLKFNEDDVREYVARCAA